MQRSDERRTAYVVMGPHRSGTSAMARVLSLSGAGLPRDLVSPHPNDNPNGFWEARSVIQLNDAILQEWGGSWSAPPQPAAVSDASVQRGRWVLQRMFPRSGPIVLKDPRISLTAAFWSAVLREEGFHPLFIVMHRPPAEVAASIQTSYGLSEDDALTLRGRYAEAALATCAPESHAVVSYAALLEDPRAILERIGVAEPAVGWCDFTEKASAFLSPALHRQRGDGVAEAETDFERRFKAMATAAPVLQAVEPIGQHEAPSIPPDLRWLLVTGAPRTGTTLLRALVDEHPDAAILQEFGLTRFVRSLDALAGRPKPIHPSWAPFAGAGSALGHAAAFYAEREAAGGGGSPGELGAVGFDGLARSLFATLSGKAPLVVGDKMPMRGEWEDVDYLQRRLPDLCVLMTVRNPRATIHSSMIRRARQELGGDLWPIRSVQEAAEEWWLAWRRAADLAQRFDASLHLFKYEDICDRPDEIMMELQRKLGLGPHVRRTPVRRLPDHVNVLNAEEERIIDNLLGEVAGAWNGEADPRRLLERFSDLPRPYVPGRRVSAASEEADGLFGEGFSWREAWGRWTDGERAVLYFRHGASGGLGMLEVHLASAFIPEGGACDVVVRAGSAPPQLFSLGAGPSRIAMLCPLDGTPGPGVLEVELEVLNPKGMNEPPADERRLGLGVESVSLRLLP